MKLSSPEFKNNGIIPSKFTCDGANINPELNISEVPEGTRSLVLIMDDPDVPKEVRSEQIWVHWILFNIPPETEIIETNSSIGNKGRGDYPNLNYGGPCPPPQYNPKEHRYFFKLYALDRMLDLPEGSSKHEIEDTMKGHIIEKAELIGRYQRNGN